MSMPRNPANKRHAVALRLPPDLLEALDAECEKRLIGRNKLVEHLLRDGLPRLPEAADIGRARSDDPRAEIRLLAEGDRITAYPCTVTIERVGIAGATGRCDYCADEHIIDRHRYESGRGPWRPADSGREAHDG